MTEAGTSSPDGSEEVFYRRLDDDDPNLARRLKSYFADQWLAAASLPRHRLDDAIASVELMYMPARESGSGARLRVRSFYTGSTYWFLDWNGTVETGEAFMEEAARLQAEDVKGDRLHGPTPWDESPGRARKRKRT